MSPEKKHRWVLQNGNRVLQQRLMVLWECQRCGCVRDGATNYRVSSEIAKGGWLAKTTAPCDEELARSVLEM